jgi:hypothetical protein
VACGLRLNVCPSRAKFILPRTSAFLALDLSAYQFAYWFEPVLTFALVREPGHDWLVVHISCYHCQSASVSMGSCSMFQLYSMAKIGGLRFRLLAAH